MHFNDLLARENIDPVGVLVLRHTPWESSLRRVLPRLASDQPDVFNAYQSTQDARVEADMLRAKQVASFIGLEKRKGAADHAAVFVGLYDIGHHRPLDCARKRRCTDQRHRHRRRATDLGRPLHLGAYLDTGGPGRAAQLAMRICANSI